MAIGQHHAHTRHEMRPVVFAVKVVHHKESAPQKIIPQPPGLRVGEAPGIHPDGVDPGIVEDTVAVEIRTLSGDGESIRVKRRSTIRQSLSASG